MISTSSYENWQSQAYRTVSISGDRGKKVNYQGECYPKLAPKRQFWQEWHNNIGVIPEEENNKFYIEEFYKQVLSKLDPEQVYRDLDNAILLCYEPNTQFCHRHIVAAWLELLLDITVPEQIAVGYDVEVSTHPEGIKEYLEIVMKKNKNMRGFTSLRALYLFEKGEALESQATQLEETNGPDCQEAKEYRQMACFLRCDADAAEEKHSAKKLTKKINNDSRK